MSSLIEQAFLLASCLHHDQVRKASIIPNAPYLSHLMEVAGMVQANGGSDEAVAAALLHDALEDISSDVSHDIREVCGEPVLALVQECTEIGTGNGGEFKASWRMRKQAYILHIATLSWSALLISVADKLQSARELKRQVRIQGDAAYAAFAKKEYKMVEERKEATIWFHQNLLDGYHSRIDVLQKEPMLVGIQALVDDFREVVQWFEKN